MIYDPANDRLIVFGGVSPPVRLNDAWQLSLSGTPTWTQLSPTGTPPTPRYGQRAIYDPLRQRMVMFGGFSGALTNETWTLSLSGAPAWQQLSPSGSVLAGTAPAGRQDVAVIYEPLGDRVIVFGGGTSSGNDTWAVNLSGAPAWTRLAPACTLPVQRSSTTGVYDARPSSADPREPASAPAPASASRGTRRPSCARSRRRRPGRSWSR
jgi:hypothetical protein